MKKSAVLLSAAIIILNFSCKNKEIPTAKLTFTTGTVILNGNLIKTPGIVIKTGDTITTADKSTCRIQIGDKTMLQLKADSQLTYNISANSNALDLQKGWLAGITRKKFTKQGKYLIKTPTVVASIRGTSYCVKVEDPDNSYFCVCNGTINLAGSDKTSGEDVAAKHHAGRRFTKNSDGSITSQEAGMLYHGDETIEALAKEIGESVDWGKVY
jgi:hypothetical protein